MFQSAIVLLLMPVGAPNDAPDQFAQLTIEQRVIIRVPLVRPIAPAPPPETEWDERKGPRCITIRSIRSAAINDRRGVDLILSGSQRYRARLERSCRSADFYSGFYLEPTGDGALCAGRDAIRSRSGAVCDIDSFKKLVPDK